MTRTTVIVVDDHDLLRQGVSGCLARFDDLEVICEAGSGEAALTVVADLQPDVVVIDLVMPGIEGRAVLSGLLAVRRDAKVLVLSADATVGARIDVLEVHVDAPPGEPALLLIRVDYRIRENNAAYNLVYPFYLQEGLG